ncbi:hydrogenase iron-sulfur subunit [Desulforhopalus sp. IMCC35007]|nr:hydrogenase iron-sulfur subunit [Desulforhopalus sp. IMCC35007]
MEGNLNAVKRVARVKKLIHKVGIDPRRVEFYNLSAAQGPRWAEICTAFTERIISLGPSPLGIALHKKNNNATIETQAA